MFINSKQICPYDAIFLKSGGEILIKEGIRERREANIDKASILKDQCAKPQKLFGYSNV